MHFIKNKHVFMYISLLILRTADMIKQNNHRTSGEWHDLIKKLIINGRKSLNNTPEVNNQDVLVQQVYRLMFNPLTKHTRVIITTRIYI